VPTAYTTQALEQGQPTLRQKLTTLSSLAHPGGCAFDIAGACAKPEAHNGPDASSY